MKKRILALQLVLLLMMSLFLQGCQKDNDEQANSTTQSTVETTVGETGNTHETTSETTATEMTETETTVEETAEASVDETVEESTEESTEESAEESLPAETTPEEKEEENISVIPGLDTPATCGALRVEGTQLVAEDGEAVQLRGISTHGLAWFPAYVNKDCFRQFREEWNANVIRLAMYTAENGGYCNGGDKEGLKQLVHDGVAYATELDMYVIIDWHILSDGNPNTYKEESKEFFAEMAETYADYNNVIYEICNEPNGGVSWQDIKSYAQEVIPVIRQYDDNAIIIVGTPNWSQYVDQAAADPITGYDNIMYALHFYAATHTDYLRNAMTAAIDAGLPIFVTEYGICDASGSGAIDEYQANEWVKTMNSYNVSYVAWNLSNKNETSAMISSGCNKVSGFSESDLSACGIWVYEMLTGDRQRSPRENTHTQESGQASGNQSGGQAGGGNGSNSNQGNAGSSTPIATTTTLTNGAIACNAEMANSWEAEGKTFYQYNLTLQNTSATDCTSWVLTLTFSDNVELSNSWCGNYTVNGNVVQISSVDYNGSIPAGGSVKDVGFIISGPAGLTLTQ